jgi:hypothetical protein
VTSNARTAFLLHLVGAISCGAAVTVSLISLETADGRDAATAAWLFVIGLVAVYVAGFRPEEDTDDQDDP